MFPFHDVIMWSVFRFSTSTTTAGQTRQFQSICHRLNIIVNEYFKLKEDLFSKGYCFTVAYSTCELIECLFFFLFGFFFFFFFWGGVGGVGGYNLDTAYIQRICFKREPLFAPFERHFVWTKPITQDKHNYRKVCNIRRTKSQNLSVSRPVWQLSLPNLLKPRIKSRMKM